MTPARLAEIRAYIARLDLDQLPGWTVEQRIIGDLFESSQGAWDDGFTDGRRYQILVDAWYDDEDTDEPGPKPPANPYRDGEQQ